MTEPETDWTYLETHDDKIRDTVEKKAEVEKLKALMDALNLALYGLDDVTDEHRKRLFVGMVSIEELDRLYKFLWRFTG